MAPVCAVHPGPNPAWPMHRTSPPTPLETLWQPPAIVAALVAGEGLALVLALAPGAGVDRLIYFGLVSLMIQWIALLTLGLMFAFRGGLASLSPSNLAWVGLGLILLNTWLVGGLAWVLFRDSWPLALDTPAWYFIRLTGISLTVGLLALAAFQTHWRSKLLAVKAEQAQLASLQARTQPHFLFNTLNTGIALARHQPEATERLLLDLADLFRAALEGPRMIDLVDELDLTRRYLEIEELRLGDRLEVRWEMPDPMPQLKVPSLSLQPLAENAIRHGIEQIVSGGRVDILVSTDHDLVHITVRNDMPDSPSGLPLGSQGHRIGLASVKERISVMTNGGGQLICGKDGKRYIATLQLPLLPSSTVKPQLPTGRTPPHD